MPVKHAMVSVRCVRVWKPPRQGRGGRVRRNDFAHWDRQEEHRHAAASGHEADSAAFPVAKRAQHIHSPVPNVLATRDRPMLAACGSARLASVATDSGSRAQHSRTEQEWTHHRQHDGTHEPRVAPRSLDQEAAVFAERVERVEHLDDDLRRQHARHMARRITAVIGHMFVLRLSH